MFTAAAGINTIVLGLGDDLPGGDGSGGSPGAAGAVVGKGR